MTTQTSTTDNLASNHYCSECDKTFSSKGNLHRHKNNVHNFDVANNNYEPNPQNKYCCTDCKKTFSLKSSLDRHFQATHEIDNEEGKSTCPYCKISFSRNSNLLRHIDTLHRDKSGSCSECNETFSDARSLLMHEQQHIKKKQPASEHQCYICDKKYSSKGNLNKHLETAHNVDCKKPATTICPLCNAAFNTIIILQKHLTEQHDVDINEEKLTFSSIDDFQKWKKRIEKEDCVFFISKGTGDISKYYDCHRSGPIGKHVSEKKLKWANSIKIGKNCPARIVTTIGDDKRIHVRFQRKHVGHAQTIQFLNLSKDDRDELAAKIKMGVTFNRILDDIRQEVGNDSNISRLQLLEKRDLHNIVRDYNLDTDVAHKDDAFSVEIWVQQQLSLKELSPVLYFKMQGIDDDGPLLKEDFMIVLMTRYQQEMIVKYTSDKVLIDSTHKTTGHDFQLTTLLTVDEYGAGCPVAFCLSNRIDAIAMKKFFESVKKAVGSISSNVIMTDDAPAYVNAWNDVMPKPKHHLLCSWHIDKNWRKNLNKVKGNMKQSEVYKTCRMLLECLDEEDFLISLNSFLLWCAADPDTEEFGKYFENHYANKADKWAYCYRKRLSLNTNMYLEAMHKKIKYCYMDGKENRRVDKCIGLLMRYSRDMMMDRVIRMAKNKPTYRMQKIAESHHRSKNISDDMIINTGQDKWIVNSSVAGRGPYSISKNLSSDCLNCPLSCPECCVCVHQFSCTCVDHLIQGNFCKHVHACIRKSKISIISAVETENPTSFQDTCDKVVNAAKYQTSHFKDTVSEKKRCESLLNIALSLVNNATDETVSKSLIQLEKIVNDLRNNQKKDQEENEDSVPQFCSLPPNLPSHRNIDKQRFFSTRKQKLVSEHRLAKPTDLEKIAIHTALISDDQSSEVVLTDFDHSYNPSTSKKISKN